VLLLLLLLLVVLLAMLLAISSPAKAGGISRRLINSIETVESEALLNCEDPKRSSPDSPCTKRPKMRVKAQMN